MRQWIRSALVQTMGSSLYLNQCWVIVSRTLRHKLQGNFIQNTKFSFTVCAWCVCVCVCVWGGGDLELRYLAKLPVFHNIMKIRMWAIRQHSDTRVVWSHSQTHTLYDTYMCTFSGVIHSIFVVEMLEVNACLGHQDVHRRLQQQQAIAWGPRPLLFFFVNNCWPMFVSLHSIAWYN